MKGLACVAAAAAGLCCASTPEERTLERAREAMATAPRRTGNLELTCLPPDAEVHVDGVLQGRCSDFGQARPLSLSQGVHSLEVRKQGFWPYETALSPGGARTKFQVKLEPMQQGAKG